MILLLATELDLYEGDTTVVIQVHLAFSTCIQAKSMAAADTLKVAANPAFQDITYMHRHCFRMGLLSRTAGLPRRPTMLQVTTVIQFIIN